MGFVPDSTSSMYLPSKSIGFQPYYS